MKPTRVINSGFSLNHLKMIKKNEFTQTLSDAYFTRGEVVEFRKSLCREFCFESNFISSKELGNDLFKTELELTILVAKLDKGLTSLSSSPVINHRLKELNTKLIRLV